MSQSLSMIYMNMYFQQKIFMGLILLIPYRDTLFGVDFYPGLIPSEYKARANLLIQFQG